MRVLSVFCIVVFSFLSLAVCGETTASNVNFDSGCINGQCDIPAVGPACRILSPPASCVLNSTRVLKQPVRTMLKKLTHPIKTICERRPAGQRWINKCGRRGPRRFIQRVRMWRPFARLRDRRCCR